MRKLQSVTSQSDTTATFLDDVLFGLSQSEKNIPCKYFYDQRGSRLFEAICETDEYYLTRAELQIMQMYVEEIAQQLDRRVRLIEYGSGSSIKTQLLLDQLEDPLAYIPVDISEEHLKLVASRLAKKYPNIEVVSIVTDFTQPFALPEISASNGHNAVYFPGSTIGNFEYFAARKLLIQIADLVGPGGGLLIGIDLHKDSSVIERAYNDAQGITAEFNKNLLVRINRELGGDFDVDAFQHHSVYNPHMRRIESSLISLVAQTVTIADEQFEFAAGEHLITEYSHKYTVEGFAEFAETAGFELHKHWTDVYGFFGVLHLVVT